MTILQLKASYSYLASMLSPIVKIIYIRSGKSSPIVLFIYSGSKTMKKSYLGSKGASGAMQIILNHTPEHKTYIEPFVGSGVIVLNKKPSFFTVVNDLDRSQMKEVVNSFNEKGDYIIDGCSTDAISLLKDIDNNESYENYYAKTETFIYCDPPYVHSTRTSNAKYKFEMDDKQHIELLTYLKSCNAKVMISGYPNDIYNDLLTDWFTVEFQSMTRGGVRTEKLWMNYDISKMLLHQTDFLGKDFTDRQRIKRKITRFNKKINALPLHERQAIFEAIQSGTEWPY